MCNYITDQLRWCDFNCHKWERFVTTNYTKSTTDHAMWQIWSSSHLTSNPWFVPICCHCFPDCSFIVLTISPFAIILRRFLWLMATSQNLSHGCPTVQQNLVLHLPSELLQTYSYSLPFLVQQYLELQLPSELLQTYSHSVKYTPILQTHSQNANSTLGGANIIQKYMMIWGLQKIIYRLKSKLTR